MGAARGVGRGALRAGSADGNENKMEEEEEEVIDFGPFAEDAAARALCVLVLDRFGEMFVCCRHA